MINLAEITAVADAQPITDRCVCGAQFHRAGPGTSAAYLAWWVAHNLCALSRLRGVA